jgi:hypothetical protein
MTENVLDRLQGHSSEPGGSPEGPAEIVVGELYPVLALTRACILSTTVRLKEWSPPPRRGLVPLMQDHSTNLHEWLCMDKKLQ